MRVIGTAGHVDHGKSTLVQALTGTHPDRLKEEREREMTIDLGFAFLTLPNGVEIGIVDVPGHRDFIENMLAGIGGIDAAIFVVAADEGVMPQTREHLAILDLLHVDGGVVALTKIDLVDDPTWIDLVQEDLQTLLRGTVLEGAPIVRLSARRGTGIPDLLNALAAVLSDRPPRPDHGRPRLPIDRVFTIAGFGTVVTGTLSDGSLSVGDEVEIQPGGLRGRVRGLQSHHRKEEMAPPGSRTAVNLSGVRLEDVQRGGWVVHPRSYPATRRLDLRFNMLPDTEHPLKHNSEAKFFIGAAEVMGRVRVLGAESIAPGESGWIQLELAAPVIARRGDHYILRRPSPGETIGGGTVVDPEPERRHRRFSAAVIKRLEALAGGTPEDVFLEAAQALGIAPLREIRARAGLPAPVVDAILPELVHAGELILFEPGAERSDSEALAASHAVWAGLHRRIMQEVDDFHGRFPLRRGIPREELRSRLKFSPAVLQAVLRRLQADGDLVESPAFVARAAHRVRFSEGQQRRVDALLARFSAAPYSPPSVKETIGEVGEEVYAALTDLGVLVQVSQEVVFRKEEYEQMLAAVRESIALHGSLTVAEFRDRFGSSRKYALGFLEHLDARGVTVREGEGRRLAT